MSGADGKGAPRAWANTVLDALGEAQRLGRAETLAADASSASASASAGSSVDADPASAREGVESGNAGFPTGALRYEVGAVLGQGGMGRVLSARDRQFGREVALKELSAATPSAEALRRFLQESVVTANLEHPGIVPVYERGVREGVPFYTMRRVAGRTLAEAIREAGTMAGRLKLLPVMVRVAHTMGFAHERGVVHRDLKPDNLILGAHGETVILDWGIARLPGIADAAGSIPAIAEVTGVAPQSGTVAGAVLGTPAYMAPEQARGELDAIDARTDVFALGAMLYELLTGHAPYTGRTAVAVLAEAAEGRVRPLAELAPDAPAPLRAVVERAMAPAPEQRYGSAAELAQALEDVQAGALVEHESNAMRWFAGALGVGGVLLLLTAAVGIVSTVAPLRQQGKGALGYVAFTTIGAALTLAEWRTRGRYSLRGVAAAVVGATALLGIANTAGGLSLVFQALSRPAMAADAVRYRAIMADGVYECVGSTASALLFAALQWMLLALVTRAVDRARARAAPGGGGAGSTRSIAR